MEILDTKGKLGYTLLEIIVVLALFAIILSIAIPSLNAIFNMRERDELKTFRRDIIFARNSAVVENSFYILTLDEKNNGYIIKKKQETDQTIKTVNFEHGIELKKDQIKNSITFKPTGAPDVGTTIYLKDSKKQDIEITITPATGSVNVKVKK